MNGVYSISKKGTSGGSRYCAPAIWIDGMISDIDMLNALHNDEIALIEVYTSAAEHRCSSPARGLFAESY
jgi:hypothetical protein